MAGKGSSRRPINSKYVSEKEVAKNFEEIFYKPLTMSDEEYFEEKEFFHQMDFLAPTYGSELAPPSIERMQKYSEEQERRFRRGLPI